MKSRNLKILAIVLMMSAFFHSCHKNDKEEPNHYVGKWKLMSRNLIGDLYLLGRLAPPVVDYSETGIYYEFSGDGVMVVSGEAAFLDLGWYSEYDLLDLFLKYEIDAGTRLFFTTFLGSDGWCGWDLSIDGDNYRLIVEEDKTKMRIYKTISYADLPNTKSDPAPEVMFGFQLEKIEE